MINTMCPRCDCSFFTAYLGSDVSCPYCGFSFKVTGQSKVRKHKRNRISRSCELVQGDSVYSALTIDICEGGVGVKMESNPSFDINKGIRVIVGSFEIDSEANVVWSSNAQDGTFTAGLKFR